MIYIDYRDPRPLYEQIVRGFEKMILQGILPDGAALPSVRSLAMELSVNPNTIQRAYNELEKNGWTVSAPGKGSFVSFRKETLDARKKDWIERFVRCLKEGAALGITKEEILALAEKEECFHDGNS
ncbi:MAG: GntR family transcriptional regulator [Erysipelotrichales bacterium]|nr:GntR family transcriptional regulator [Erysipelotrichales bacterium]MBQ4375596.1 GntR family transcriptional regulator [Erysipelotrichales bacterium]